MPETLLAINNLNIAIGQGLGCKEIVKEINLEVCDLSVMALVGGSGGGKTMTGLSILRLLPAGINIQSGTILFNGENLLDFSRERMRQVRGKEISMIFQEPLSTFNPVFTIGYQINEVLKCHTALNKRQRREKVCSTLDIVGIPDPRRITRSYAHQLSGGLRQRAMIAQAIAAEPKLLIADEPTSNLDVTLQARIIELFRKLKGTLKLSILLITHDLGVVKQLADEVAVLYDGKIVERSPIKDIMENPKHPFTKELIKSIEVA